MAAEKHPLPMTGAARDALISAIVLCICFAIVVAFRVVGRVRWSVLGPDDYLAVAACVLTFTTIGMSSAVYTAGVGYDLVETSPVYPDLVVNLVYILQNTFAFVGVYLWALAFMKLSQCCLYWRVFSMQLKWWIIATGIIVIIWAIVFTFVAIFLCHPVEAQWSVTRSPDQCMDQIVVLKSLIMTNIITDIFIVLLPIWTVWQLNMKVAEKATVICCFGLGFGCVIIGIVRFVEMFTIDLAGNLTGTSLRTFMLCTVELCMAGLCTNLPMLRPFYRRWKNKTVTEKNSSYAVDESRLTGNGNGAGAESSQGWTSRIVNGKRQQPNFSAWVELDETQVRKSTSVDGTGSERGLTGSVVEPKGAAIKVTTDWKVDRI